MTHASLLISCNPLRQVSAADAQRVEARGLIADLAPRDAQGPVVCRVNGEWLLRAHWQRPVAPGDVVEFHVLPQGARDKATLLQVAALAAAVLAPQMIPGIIHGPWTSALVSMAASMATTAIGSRLLGLNESTQAGTSSDASPTYSASLAGNQARIDQAIPVGYGYHRYSPDFAAQPYTEFGQLVTAGVPTPVYAGSDQYYHALLCLGQGEYAVRRVMVGDTPIEHFSDVEYRILRPGELPTLVDPAVVTSEEVAGQELLTGQYLGGYVAVPAGRAARAIAIDIGCPGLGIAASDGSMSNRTVTFQVQTRVVDDVGIPQSSWTLSSTISMTDATTDQVRASYWVPITTPARIEVRLLRTDLKQDTRDNLDDVYWTGLRAYLTDTVTLCPTATHIEVRMRASEQLNGLSQRLIRVTAVRKLRTWSSAGGWSAGLVETRNPAWALADKWTNSAYGDGLPDSRIDLLALEALAAQAEARQDRCDIVFDQTTGSDEADQLIASTIRSSVVRRHGVRTVVRDEAVALPVAAFSGRNMVPGSWRLLHNMPTSDSPDGLLVEYLDNRTWDWVTLSCPLPGVSTITRPERVRLYGITGQAHARREGVTMAAAMLYRRTRAAWSTELEGSLPAYGSVVRYAPPMTGWAQSGDVVAVSGLTLTLSEPPEWTPAATHYVCLQTDVGGITTVIECTPGASPDQVVLASAPGITISTTDGGRERTRYLFGTGTALALLVQIRSISPEERGPGEEPVYALEGVLDDPAVHLADAAWLPTPGVEQDPVDDGTGASAGGGSIVIVNLTSHTIRETGVGESDELAVTVRNDGRLVLRARGVSASDIEIDQQWSYAVISPTLAADMEVMAVEVSDWPATSAGLLGNEAMGVWLSCGTSRTWNRMRPGTGGTFHSLRLRIRRVSTGIVEGEAVISAYFEEFGTGGD